jgi:hypothetical protein
MRPTRGSGQWHSWLGRLRNKRRQLGRGNLFSAEFRGFTLIFEEEELFKRDYFRSGEPSVLTRLKNPGTFALAF